MKKFKKNDKVIVIQCTFQGDSRYIGKKGIVVASVSITPSVTLYAIDFRDGFPRKVFFEDEIKLFNNNYPNLF